MVKHLDPFLSLFCLLSYLEKKNNNNNQTKNTTTNRKY